MKKVLLALALLCGLAGTASAQNALGVRILGGTSWGGQLVLLNPLGAGGSHLETGLGIGLRDPSASDTLTTTIQVNYQYRFAAGARVRPYLGAGLFSDLYLAADDCEGANFGLTLQAGVDFLLGTHFLLGAHVQPMLNLLGSDRYKDFHCEAGLTCAYRF